MKRLLLSFITVLCSVILLNAQESYEVISSSSLNVRSYASTSGQVIGTLNSGTVVNVYEINGDWAKIIHNGRYGYISSKYIRKSLPQSEEKVVTSQTVERESAKTYNVEWMIWVILGLTIVLSIVNKKVRDGYILVGTEYFLNSALFLLICIFECIYFIKMGDERVWFCMPDEIGWLGAIIGFIAFGWVVYTQIFGYFDVIRDIKYNAGDFNMKIGLYSWPVAIVLGLIASFAGWDGVINWIIAILVVCQIIQIVIIYVQVEEKGGAAHAVFACFVYLLASIATILITLQFIQLLIIVAIALFVICALASGSSKSSSSRDDEDEMYLEDEHGHVVRVRKTGWDRYEGYNGKTYIEEPGGKFKEKDW